MKYQKALEMYLSDLEKGGYSGTQIERKGCLLRNWLSCALTLHHPGIPGVLEKIEQPLFYYKKRIHPDVDRAKRETAGHFLSVFREEREKIKRISMASFLDEYLKRFCENDSGGKQKSEVILSFCRAVGFGVEMQSITEKVYLQCLEYLNSFTIQRAMGCSRLFFIHCFENGWVRFNPHEQRRSPYVRTFEPDFIGAEPGVWRDRLREYIHYLQFERNLSDGGIDYQVRKLKVFTSWLDSQGIKQPDIDIIKRFFEKKKKAGVKDITINKYLYIARYFFSFLVERRIMKSNPAVELRIKVREHTEGDILTELEVNQVIEYLENEVYKAKGAKEIEKMKIHFRAVRDLCLFQLFTFTGLRLSEVTGAKLTDIDFEKRSIKITGKGNRGYRQKSREILINDYLWQSIRRYLKVRNYPGQQYLWISFKGAPMGNSGINKIITSRVKQAGIDKKISPHRLRATGTSLYVKKGMDPFSLKTLMGHQSIATTMDKYARLTEDELRAVWKKTNPLAGMDDE